MRQTEVLQEIRKMRFLEVYDDWQSGRLSQEEAGQLLGMGDRNFRRSLPATVKKVRLDCWISV